MCVCVCVCARVCVCNVLYCVSCSANINDPHTHRLATGALNVMRSQGQCTMKKDNQSETCLVTGQKSCFVEILMIRSVYGEQVCVLCVCMCVRACVCLLISLRPVPS